MHPLAFTAGFAATMDYKQIRSTVDEVSKYSQSREKVAVKYSEHEKVLAKVALIMEKRYDVITLDGIKGIVDADSWVLVRASNTEDVIRVSSESNDAEKSTKLTADAKRMVLEAADC